jgi:hypothetical protein
MMRDVGGEELGEDTGWEIEAAIVATLSYHENKIVSDHQMVMPRRQSRPNVLSTKAESKWNHNLDLDVCGYSSEKMQQKTLYDGNSFCEQRVYRQTLPVIRRRACFPWSEESREGLRALSPRTFKIS